MAVRCNNAFVPKETEHSDGEISISFDIKWRNNGFRLAWARALRLAVVGVSGERLDSYQCACNVIVDGFKTIIFHPQLFFKGFGKGFTLSDQF